MSTKKQAKTQTYDPWRKLSWGSFTKAAIYIDDTTKAVSVNDIENQYVVVSPYESNDATYFLIEDTTSLNEVLQPNFGLVTKTDFTFEVKATDNEALSKVIANLKDENGGHLSSCINESAGGATEYTATCVVDVDSLAEGIYIMRTNATDEAGNLSQTLSHQFIVDRSGPSIVVNHPENNHVTSGNFDIGVTVIDDNAVGKVVVNIKDEFGVNLASCLNETVSVATTTYNTGCTVDISSLNDGTYQFRTNALDAAGNISNTISQTFVIDREKPFIEVISPENGFVTFSDFEITIRATDNLGLTQIVLNLKDENGDHLAPCVNEQAGGVKEYTTTCSVDVSELGAGVYGFRTNARDGEGKISNTVSQTFEIVEEPEFERLRVVGQCRLADGGMRFSIRNLNPQSFEVTYSVQGTGETGINSSWSY